MKIKVIAMATLLASLVVLTQSKQDAIADNIHSGNSSDYLLCATACHVYNNIHAQPAYRLAVKVPIFGAATAISINTANGYTDHVNVNTSMASTGVATWTFNIPQNQGNWVQVCHNSETLRGNCIKYATTGRDMLVSLSPVAYQLTVKVPFHPFGASTVDISVTTKNGYTDEATASAAGVATWTFNIPQNQGKWVEVCVNFSPNCHKYETSGSDMSVLFREALASP
jgi:hypothetical protein